MSKSLTPKDCQKVGEIWRDVKGYEGLYQVSDIGRVKSLERRVAGRNGSMRTIRGRILSPRPNPCGYLRVYLSRGHEGKKRFFVHRLVCRAFNENPQNKPEVNHINEDKLDNRACNLEWVTVKENRNHGTRPARVAKALSKPICQYTLDGKLIKVWQSAKEVQSQLGFSQGHISKVARGKLKTAYGYVWKYIEEGKVNS